MGFILWWLVIYFIRPLLRIVWSYANRIKDKIIIFILDCLLKVVVPRAKRLCYCIISSFKPRMLLFESSKVCSCIVFKCRQFCLNIIISFEGSSLNFYYMSIFSAYCSRGFVHMKNVKNYWTWIYLFWYLKAL